MEASRLLGKDGSKPSKESNSTEPQDGVKETHDAKNTHEKKSGLSAKIKGALHKD